MEVKFEVPAFAVCDPAAENVSVPVSVRGSVRFETEDGQDAGAEALCEQIRDAAAGYVKAAVADAPFAAGIPLSELEIMAGQISDAIQYDASAKLNEAFDVMVYGLEIEAIEFDRSSEGYRRLISRQ